MSVSKVLVVGGGITGSMLAVALAGRGVEVHLAEISPRWFGVGHGITVQGNALKALRSIGVLDRVLEHAVPFDMLRMRRADGSLIAEVPTPRTGGDDLPATAGSLRSSLQEALCDAVSEAGVTVRLGLSVARFDQAPGHVDVTFTDGSSGRYDLVAGADGIQSRVRSMLGFAAAPRPVGMSIFRFVAARPPEMDCAEVYYGGPRYKAGYSPISADRCYAYLLDENLDASLISSDAPMPLLRERGAGYGGMWGAILESLPEGTRVDYRWIESILLEDPWYAGRVIVVGDAAHACPPLIAQGAAMCAEDAVVLAEQVTGTAPLEKALREFMDRRMPRVRTVLDNSLLLADWEINPGTPGADPAGVMSRTLDFLREPA
ncbi:FAD-dependent monooxygenase [Actinomadura fibrosa]|uniref:FAD-dependent monooxygenase n=1 Tax=Actinomadura fibrosa TaxID=111802 RepID=A0ABW2XQI0_9ACTN|nr:FAD-dependent monooxygenase [Actinomadura fibrosa]